jgi:hypothetical protein
MILRVLQQPASRLLPAVAALALAVSGLFGGWSRVDDPQLPAVAPDTVDEGVPWNVTVTGIRVVAELPGLDLQNRGDRWVAVLATVEVTADESRNDLADAVRIPSVAGLLSAEDDLAKGRPEEVILLRGDVRGPYLNPGLPEKLAFIWEQRAAAAVPKSVTVEIWGKTLREDSLTGHRSWFDPQVRATVPDVPVQDRRKA